MSSASASLPSYSAAQVAQHASKTDCWVIIENRVFDVTNFLSEHPGGLKILANKGGKDATKQFKMFHKDSVLQQYASLQVGWLEGHAPSTAAPVAVASLDPLVRYGEQVPHGDPAWYQGNHSPYYTASHVRFRAKVRAFVEKEIAPYVHEWDENYAVPKELYKKAALAGILPAVCGPPWPTNYVDADVTPPEKFDAFHELICLDEIARCGSGGTCWGLIEGLSIGLPPVMLFGSQYLKDKVARDCMMGDKFICLAITEPSHGSDVAGLTTTAVKTPDGKHYIVNGTKKWITNGLFADYFCVAVRTGGPGAKGLSMLLLERDTMPGITTRHMKCMGSWPSATTLVSFEDVKVPVENLIGVEGNGFKQIMYNFNHERWALIAQSNRLARVCYEEAFKYATKRKTFGKTLMQHQLIRFKLAEMGRMIESTHAWMESITYQMTQMPHAESMKVLGGPIALLKAHSTKVFEYCAREAAQIFGGASYVRGGVGEKIERLYREVRSYAIPGGSEEILEDFAVKQAARAYQSKL